MRNCKNCGQHIPIKLVIDSKEHNLQRRKFCLSCSPFGSGNRRDLTQPKKTYKDRSFWKEKKYRQYQQNIRRTRKQKLVNMFGGQCSKCGYSKCIAALVFHHRKPEEKLFTVCNAHMCLDFDRVIEEAKKCDLLCANCHAELHYNEDVPVT